MVEVSEWCRNSTYENETKTNTLKHGLGKVAGRAFFKRLA